LSCSYYPFRSFYVSVNIMDLTKYEVARLIGARALQLSMGAPPLIKVTDERMSFLQIAEVELEKGIIPLVVVRAPSREAA
jgi:DNA-directed RNA polymerases I, II, and III subunit RPABC2